MLTNRHWTNKNCLPWAKEYFSKALTDISAEDGANKVTTKNLSSCEGDVDVNQRKGKIRTLYDVKLVIDFEGSPPEFLHLTIQARQRMTKVSVEQLRYLKLHTTPRKMNMWYIPLLSVR